MIYLHFLLAKPRHFEEELWNNHWNEKERCKDIEQKQCPRHCQVEESSEVVNLSPSGGALQDRRCAVYSETQVSYYWVLCTIRSSLSSSFIHSLDQRRVLSCNLKFLLQLDFFITSFATAKKGGAAHFSKCWFEDVLFNLCSFIPSTGRHGLSCGCPETTCDALVEPEEFWRCFCYVQWWNCKYSHIVKKEPSALEDGIFSFVPAPPSPLHKYFLYTWMEMCFAITFFQSLQHV